jgi:hypothetical protein
MNSQSAFEAVNGKILQAEVSISAGHVFLKGELALPDKCNAIVLYVHGSSRHSPQSLCNLGAISRNRHVSLVCAKASNKIAANKTIL